MAEERATTRKEHRREQILSAAARVFADSGYQRASISDIIEAAGIARGTFYLYFSSKAKVFESILEESLAGLRARITRVDVTPGAPPPRQQLLGSIYRVLEYLVEDRHRTTLLLRSALGPGDDVADRLRAFYAEVEDLIESSLTHGVDMGLVRKCDLSLVAAALLGAVRGVVGHLIERSPDADLSAAADEILLFALSGVVTEKLA